MRCFADRSLTFASDLLSPPQITRLYFNLSFLYVRAKVQPDCFRTDSELSDERQIGYEISIALHVLSQPRSRSLEFAAQSSPFAFASFTLQVRRRRL